MLVAAGLEHKTPAEIADAYEAAFHADEALLNILPAHVFPRATEHIPEMIDARRAARRRRPRLRQRPRATSTTRWPSFPGYGRLSGNTLDELRAGHRGDVEPDKRDAADFALWKAAGEGRMLKWPTAALGRGLPGLAPRVLGDGDAPPRRRASTSTPAGSTTSSPITRTRSPSRRRSSAAPPARLWVHGEFLLMSAARRWPSRPATSSGSPSWRDRGIDPLAFRYLVPDLALSATSSTTPTRRSRGGRRAGVTPGAVCAALGPAPADGPWAAPAPCGPGAAGDRPIGHRDRASPGNGGGAEPARSSRSGRTPRPPPLSDGGPGAPRAVRRRRSTTTSTCRRRSRSIRETSAPTSPPTSGAGWSSTPTPSSGSDLDRVWATAPSGRDADRRRPTSPRCSPSGPTPARRGTSPAADRAPRRARGRSAATVTDGPDGPTVGAAPASSQPAGREVPPRAEPVDDPVEVALAQAVPLRRPAGSSSRDARGGRPASSTATARRGGAPLPFVAQDEAPPDVEVAVEAEPLVERAARRGVGAPERHGVALDRVDVARPARPRTCAGRRDTIPHPPATRDRRVVEGADQRRDDVAGRLDARVEDDDDRSRRPPDADVERRRRGRAARSSGRPRSIAVARRSTAPSASSCSSDGASATTTTDVPSGACARRPRAPARGRPASPSRRGRPSRGRSPARRAATGRRGSTP